MSRYFEMLMEDVRFREGLKSCMNCGICTGVCPAAEFYDYDPRQIVAIVQTRDEEQIERLLKGDTIWFCGECMSCRPRCPRGNTPGYCVTPKLVAPDLHPEQGPVWSWVYRNDREIYCQFNPTYDRPGPGAVRRIDDATLGELHRIFDETGGTAFFENIERCSERKARELGYDGADERYFMDVYTRNSQNEDE